MAIIPSGRSAAPGKNLYATPRRRAAAAGALALLAGLIAGVATSFAGAAPAAGAAAKTFLNSIYQHYVGRSAGDAAGIALTSPKAIRGYFTVGLASLIIDDRAAAAKRGETPVLDGDPFVGHQDWDISNLVIEVKDGGAVKALGTVSFVNAGKPEKVVLELLRFGKEWRIADIDWGSGSLRGLYRRKAARDDAAAR